MPGQHQPVRMSRRTAAQLAEFRAMAEEQLVRLGGAIERRRKELGWSRSRLAREIPVDVKTVERWEKAQTGGAMDVLTKIAEALQTTAEGLLASSLEQGPAPDPFANEAAVTGGEVRAKLDELLSGQAELLSTLSEVRDEQARLRRLQEPGSHDAEGTGS